MAEKNSIKNNVYNILKDAILTKKLSPGSQIIENTISTHLQVSRTPIRSAMNQLADEGLIEMIPNRGAYVINPTRDEIVQAYELRKELEVMAVKKSLGQFTKKDFVEINALIQLEKKALAAKNFESYLEINTKFHLLITKKCNNIFLIDFIETLIQRTNAYLILFDRFLDEETFTPYGYKEHEEIMNVLKEGNKEELILSVEKHFDNAISSLRIKNEYTTLDDLFK